MRRILAIIALFVMATAPASAQPAQSGATSSIIEGEDNQLFLRQTVIVEADLDRTWAMFTTAEGASQWMAPVMEIDLRPGGTIQANYDADAAIGDAGTIENRIVNYVPRRLLTLQADLEAVGEADWLTEEVRANADQLYNIIEFEALDPARTRVTSWGIGYRKGAGWQKMIDFFAVANVWSLNRLAAAASSPEAEAETVASPPRSRTIAPCVWRMRCRGRLRTSDSRHHATIALHFVGHLICNKNVAYWRMIA